MEIQPQRPATKAPAETFTGDAWFDVIAQGQPPSRLRGQRGPVCPGRAQRLARSRQRADPARHRGNRPQSRGEKITEIHPGDTVWTPPGEWHWHGAAPGHFMTHLAMWESLADGQEGPETSWGDLVTGEEFNA